MILEEEALDVNLENPELRVELVASVPVPAALPLPFSALAGLGFARRGGDCAFYDPVSAARGDEPQLVLRLVVRL